MRKIIPVFLFISIILPSLIVAQKEKPLSNVSYEILPDDGFHYETKSNIRYNKSLGVPEAIYNVNYQVRQDTPEKMAFQYLMGNADKLGKIKQDELRIIAVRETPGGYRVRFQQYYNEYNVYNSTIVVSINRNNEVVFVMNGYKPGIELINEISFNEEDARTAAINHLELSGRINLEKTETVVFYNNGKSKLVHKINIVPAEKNIGDWEVLVDAQSGELIKVFDQASYRHRHSDGPETVTASGWLFDPDPINSSGASYGDPGFSDAGDADSDSLTAHTVQRDLLDVTLSGSTYQLKGPYAEVVDSESPFTGLHSQSSPDFHYTRSNDNFEAVNCYFHIDQSMRYINETLLFPLMPFQYSTGVRVDPHGLSNADNSHYIPSTGEVAFGDGGVDDAEDLFVVLHELGHGIHDWVTNGSLSQVDGLSEGSGDYWAMSYIRTQTVFTSSDPEYDWSFIWDGHNEFWPGRVTDYPNLYPGGLVGQIHTDGQIWASSLMQVYDLIGREATDKNFLEALSMLNGSSSQEDAANAFIQADQDLFAGVHLSDIYSVFQARGYVSGPLTVDFEADITVGGAPLTVQFTDLSSSINGPITSWSWDFDGDNLEDSNIENPTWVYSDAGTYTVSLTASDGTNQLTTTKNNYIKVRSDFVVWFDDFESSGAIPEHWTITNDGGSDVWTIIDEPYPNTYTMPGTSSGKLLAADSDEGGSGSNLLSTATLKVPLDLSDIRNALLEFDSDFNALDAQDECIVEVSSDSVTWTEVLHFTGNDVRETHEILDISAVADSQATVWIRFISIQPGWDWWWCVDNVGIFGNSEPLPVELTSFKANQSNGTVHLYWETATEINNAGFDILRSSDGSSFTKIAFVEGNGTTAKKSFYNFSDNSLISNTVYYKLRQIDHDGTLSYSNIIEVTVAAPTKYTLQQNYPNPFNPATTIIFSLVEPQQVKLTLYNSVGETVKTITNKKYESGIHKVEFNASSLASGIYFYRIDAGKFSDTKKLMLLK